MKTAMQELIEYIELYQPKNKVTDGIWSKAKHLLEKEKEQIIKANRDGVDMCICTTKFLTGEGYFKETFKS